MATIKHRFQTAIANDPAADVGADEWNDSLVVAGGTDAGLFYRDAAAADGWSIATGLLTNGLKLTKYNNAAPANGQLLIGNTAGGTYDVATLTGTANQVTVTNGAGSITLSTPQDIHTGATPQFARLGLGGAADANALLKIASGLVYPSITRTSMSGNATLTNTSNQYQMFDPNGADRDVTLPTAETSMAFVIKHFGSANTITVKRADATTLVTLTAGDTATAIYDGTAWQVL